MADNEPKGVQVQVADARAEDVGKASPETGLLPQFTKPSSRCARWWCCGWRDPAWPASLVPARGGSFGEPAVTERVVNTILTSR